jgi:hypothetical protein
MTYLKNEHIQTLHDVKNIIEKRKDTLDNAESTQYKDFCHVLDDISSDVKRSAEISRERMRKYRSTPEGREKNRLMSQKYRELKKQESKK